MKSFNMDFAIHAYIKGDTHEGSEKTAMKNIYSTINFTYAIPSNDFIACFISYGFGSNGFVIILFKAGQQN